MFADQGYTGVGTEDIGAARNSIHNRFPTERDLLTTALECGTAARIRVLAALSVANDTAGTPRPWRTR